MFSYSLYFGLPNFHQVHSTFMPPNFLYSTEIQPFFIGATPSSQKASFLFLLVPQIIYKRLHNPHVSFLFLGRYMELSPRHQTIFLVHGNSALSIGFSVNVLYVYPSRWYFLFPNAKVLKYACNINIYFQEMIHSFTRN